LGNGYLRNENMAVEMQKDILGGITSYNKFMTKDSGVYNVKDYQNDDLTYVLGNGTQDDTTGINKAILACPNYGTVYFPPTNGSFYNVTQLTIGPNKTGIHLVGAGLYESHIKFTGLVGFSCGSEMCCFSDMKVQGSATSILAMTGTIMFKDTRNLTSADFDLNLSRCYIMEVECAIVSSGRGVLVDNCAFYHIYYTAIKADFPPKFIAGPYDIHSAGGGFRGFIVRNSRFHYTECWIITNEGTNYLNLMGVLITGNQIEGPTCYIKGYVRDLEFSGNVHYQGGVGKDKLVHRALFDFIGGCDNVNIDINFRGKNPLWEIQVGAVQVPPVADAPQTDWCRRLIYTPASSPIINIRVTGVISDVYYDIFDFNGGGRNIYLDIVADHIAIAAKASYGYVNFRAGNYYGLMLSGVIESPEDLAVERAATVFRAVRSAAVVKFYYLDFQINGLYKWYDGLN